MSEFSFRTDARSRAFCEEIAQEMHRIFGFGREEAVGRINRQWYGNDFFGDEDLRYHEAPDFWAQDIAYGSSVPWHLGESGVKPKPYP